MTKVVRVRTPGGIEQFEVADIEIPPPAADELRIRQTAIGVNFVDIYQRTGLYPMPPANIPGVEGVGVVTAIGAERDIGSRSATASPMPARRSGPTRWSAIFRRGGRSSCRTRFPTKHVASSFVKGITAHMLLDRVYPVGSRTTLLVHSAAGGLGQLTDALGEPSRRDRDRNRRFGSQGRARAEAGAQHVIVGRDADFAQAVADITGRRGVDVAYDGVGGATLAKTLACVRPFGVVASIGQTAGPIPPVDVADLGPRRSLSLARPSVMAYMNEIDAYRSAAEAVLAGIESGILSVSGQSYALSEAARAHADLEAGRTSGALYLKP